MKKIFILAMFTLLITGCAHTADVVQKEEEVIPKTDTNTSTTTNEISVQVENGTVYLTDPSVSGDQKQIIGVPQKQTPKTIEDNLSQYSFTKAELSPSKRFVAMQADGWETEYLKVYSIADQKTFDVKAENLCPITSSWTIDGLLTGKACGCERSFCGEEKNYSSVSSDTPWLIVEVK